MISVGLILLIGLHHIHLISLMPLHVRHHHFYTVITSIRSMITHSISLQAQNLHFSQVLPSIDCQYLTPRLPTRTLDCISDLLRSSVCFIFFRQRRRYMFCPCLFVCLSVCLLAKLLKNACIDLSIWMKCCVSTDVGTWTN